MPVIGDLVPDTIGDIEKRTEKQRFKRIGPTLRKAMRTSKRYIKAHKGPFKGIFYTGTFRGFRHLPVDVKYRYNDGIRQHFEAWKYLLYQPNSNQRSRYRSQTL